MSLDHATLVAFAKSFGLFYLIVLWVAVVVYAWWPSNRKPFEDAARAILHDEEGPWR